MLFPILESNEKKRREAILKVASRDLELGFLMSVFNLEWTIRRMILHFAKCPSIVIRSLLARSNGYPNYCYLWKICVHDFDKRLNELPNILGTNDNKNDITEYIRCRHVLVHGARSGIGAATALCGIKKLLEAAEFLIRFARENGHELFKRVPPRQVRCGFTGAHHTPLFVRGDTCVNCPGKIVSTCPFVRQSVTTTRERGGKCLDDQIRKSLRAAAPSVRELEGIKDEALIAKMQEVAWDLGILERRAVKKAVHDLQKAIEKRKNSCQ